MRRLYYMYYMEINSLYSWVAIFKNDFKFHKTSLSSITKMVFDRDSVIIACWIVYIFGYCQVWKFRKFESTWICTKFPLATDHMKMEIICSKTELNFYGKKKKCFVTQVLYYGMTLPQNCFKKRYKMYMYMEYLMIKQKKNVNPTPFSTL